MGIVEVIRGCREEREVIFGDVAVSLRASQSALRCSSSCCEGKLACYVDSEWIV